jgi:hypothetical protein
LILPLQAFLKAMACQYQDDALHAATSSHDEANEVMEAFAKYDHVMDFDRTDHQEMEEVSNHLNSISAPTMENIPDVLRVEESLLESVLECRGTGATPAIAIAAAAATPTSTQDAKPGPTINDTAKAPVNQHMAAALPSIWAWESQTQDQRKGRQRICATKSFLMEHPENHTRRKTGTI